MPLSLSLAALLTLAAPVPDPADDARAGAVAPFVGEEVAAVVHLDLTKWDARTSLRRVLGKLADDDDVSGAIKVVSGWIDALKQAGAQDLFVLIDPADM